MDLEGILIGFMIGVFKKELLYGGKNLLEYMFNIKPKEPKADDKK